MQISDEMKALEALARAYDHEEAACMGEPSPWVSADAEGDDEWKAERIVAARAGLDAYRAALFLPVQPVAWPEAVAGRPIAWLSAKGIELLKLNSPEVRVIAQTGPDENFSTPLYTTPPVPPTKGPEDDLIAAREAAEDIEINYVVCDPKEVREQVAAAIVDALRKDRALRSRPLGAAVSGGRPWGVHTIASMFSPNNYAGLPDGRYVRSVAEPYRGNRAISAWWVLTGRAHAVVWPNAGDLEAAIEKDERP